MIKQDRIVLLLVEIGQSAFCGLAFFLSHVENSREKKIKIFHLFFHEPFRFACARCVLYKRRGKKDTAGHWRKGGTDNEAALRYGKGKLP